MEKVQTKYFVVTNNSGLKQILVNFIANLQTNNKNKCRDVIKSSMNNLKIKPESLSYLDKKSRVFCSNHLFWD